MRLLKKKNEHRYRKKNTGNIEYTGIFTDQKFCSMLRKVVKQAQNVINSSRARSHNAGHGLKKSKRDKL